MDRTVWIAAIALFAPVLWADQVILKNGDRLTGTIVEHNEKRLRLVSPYGQVTFDRRSVMTFTITPKMDPLSAAKRRILSHIQILGLPDAREAKVLLINAGGANCRDSYIVSGSDAAHWTSMTTDDRVQVTTGDKGHKAGSYRMDIAANIPSKGFPKAEDCWCTDGPEWRAEQAGIAVMAPGKAIAYFPNERRTSGYRLCTEPKEDFFVDMRAKREVPLKVWVGEGNHIASLARDDIANADWVFDKQLAGITLRPVYTRPLSKEFFQTHLPQCYPATPGASVTQGDCCQGLPESDMFDAGAINVYYGVGSGNFTCNESPTLPASFIHDVPILGDAAHEISHALGLSQRDTDAQREYSTGHTSPLGAHQSETNFACGNVMWERTHYLKDELSAGQAFWMSQSCMSFAGRNGACLACSDQPGEMSPCPRFSLGAGPPGTSPCLNATVVVEQHKTLIPRQREPSDSCDRPNTTYVDGLKIEASLSARYDVLRAHVRTRPDLRLGASTKAQFLKHWEPNVALNLAVRGDEANLVLPPGIENAGLRTLVDSIVVNAKPIPGCVTAPRK